MAQTAMSPLSILLAYGDIPSETTLARSGIALIEQLQARGFEVVRARSADDGESAIRADPLIGAVIVDADIDPSGGAETVLRAFRARNDRAPAFLFGERSHIPEIPLSTLKLANEFIWLVEDTPSFIAGRIEAAIQRYRENLLPPMFSAMLAQANVRDYAFGTPGHLGGTAFLKTPVSKVFFEYFGENMLRSDLSIGMAAVGSLLDHSGPIGESERFAARVFGAHRSYTTTNGTSGSNRTIFMASLTQNDIALCDRNCHKSIEHGLVMTGAIPVYLVPHRNRYGIIGPIYPEDLQPETVRARADANPLTTSANRLKPRHTIITNSTYDGLIYNVERVIEIGGDVIDRLHFDEAWYAYARFNPLYRGRHAMFGDPAEYTDGPTLFATHSTHKLLAALSQASFIHIRDGRDPIEHARFNESFMMHASTSPFYPIIASNEISAAMMEGASGVALTTEAIREAVSFRQTVGLIKRQYAQADQWFFSTWNATEITDPASGQRLAFEDAPEALLVTDPDCWVLHPDDAWHGFDGLEDGYCMLDPIKVTVVAPGVAGDGQLEQRGIPASIIAAYLVRHGFEYEKVQDFTILFLFSIGMTKAKWGTLLTTLIKFKEDYDANIKLEVILPGLVTAYPERYGTMGLRDLSDEMFDQYKQSGQMHHLQQAFSTLPSQEMIPAEAYRRLVRNQVERVRLDEVAHRTVATSIVPYPPGIPMMMPGESAGPADGPCIGYLKALRDWDRRFPGFTHETHGIEVRGGEHYLQCLKQPTQFERD
ncbi:Orn/Lys/Arg decarboxylase N-terminal domain-containing protein [Mesorhizobium sp. LHD-90]|uniref:Orn/Lys/Arg family decarboxylase n=1 Tax=Mesorhizobium sp. LHD-90 TaxID=3071414 RepID=UPI0027DF4350|nr:Orn/Lys/Arg decarboxylase N-terminal domain-containing protein [Mesorhizobium sp. LHD-90]MDQ6436570.1 Orn/Lys/Arg decarboxylase N-terminal domain-containing protein [Mesorhizobium sp. LHD-90]